MWWNEDADTWILAPAQRNAFSMRRAWPQRSVLVCRLFRQSGYGDFSCAVQLKSVVWWRSHRCCRWRPVCRSKCTTSGRPSSDRLCRRLKTPAPIPPAAGRRAPPVCRSARQRLRVQRNCGGTTKASRTPQELHARQTKRCRNRCRLMLKFQLSPGRSGRI
jgi:hypothetical protein